MRWGTSPGVGDLGFRFPTGTALRTKEQVSPSLISVPVDSVSLFFRSSIECPDLIGVCIELAASSTRKATSPADGAIGRKFQAGFRGAIKGLPSRSWTSMAIVALNYLFFI